MKKLLGLLGAIAVVVFSIDNASAATVLEDIIVSYASNVSFNLTSVTFGSPNLITFSPTTAPPNPNGVLLNQFVSLDTNTTYALSFGGTYLSKSFSLSDSYNYSDSASQSFTSSHSLGPPGGPSLSVTFAVSPAPLPASLPLFALALIGLGAFAYHNGRVRRRSEVQLGGVVTESA